MVKTHFITLLIYPLVDLHDTILMPVLREAWFNSPHYRGVVKKPIEEADEVHTYLLSKAFLKVMGIRMSGFTDGHYLDLILSDIEHFYEDIVKDLVKERGLTLHREDLHKLMTLRESLIIGVERTMYSLP